MPVVGIQNSGNTCSTNTLLQCLYHSPIACSLILNTDFPSESFGAFVRQILRDMKSAGEKTGHNIASPPTLILQQFDVALDTFSKGLFPRLRQHDACELWLWIVNQLHEDVAVKKNVTYIHKSGNAQMGQFVAETLHTLQQGKYSDWLSLIQGSQIAQVRCIKCNHIVNNAEPMCAWNIDIPNQDEAINIGSLMANTLGRETIDDWKCDACSNRGGERVMRFWDIPRVLTVFIKRFDPMQRKIHTPVILSQGISFSSPAVINIDRRITFSLVGIVHHHGRANFGHYTATVRVPKSNTDDEWFHVNDDLVQPISADELSRTLNSTKTAYALFYERDD